MNLPSQQFYLCGTLFNVHDTLMKHALRLALEFSNAEAHVFYSRVCLAIMWEDV